MFRHIVCCPNIQALALMKQTFVVSKSIRSDSGTETVGFVILNRNNF